MINTIFRPHRPPRPYIFTLFAKANAMINTMANPMVKIKRRNVKGYTNANVAGIDIPLICSLIGLCGGNVGEVRCIW